MGLRKDSLQIIREKGKTPEITQLLPEACGMQAFEESDAATRLDAALARIATEQTEKLLAKPTVGRKSRRRGGRKTPYTLAKPDQAELPDPLADFQLPTEIEFEQEQIGRLLAIAAVND